MFKLLKCLHDFLNCVQVNFIHEPFTLEGGELQKESEKSHDTLTTQF